MGCGSSAKKYEALTIAEDHCDSAAAEKPSTPYQPPGSPERRVREGSLKMVQPRKQNRLPSTVMEEEHDGSDAEPRVIFLDIVLLGPQASKAAERAATSQIMRSPLLSEKLFGPKADNSHTVTCKVGRFCARVKLHPIERASQPLPRFQGAYGTQTAYVVLLPVDCADVDFQSSLLTQRLDEVKFEHRRQEQPCTVAYVLIGVGETWQETAPWLPPPVPEFRPSLTFRTEKSPDSKAEVERDSEDQSAHADAPAYVEDPDWYKAFGKFTELTSMGHFTGVRVVPLSNDAMLCETLVERTARLLINGGAVDGMTRPSVLAAYDAA